MHRQRNTRLHKYSTQVNPPSRRLCGKILSPILKIKPMGKWCKWHHTTGFSLSLWITSCSLGRARTTACPAALLVHHELGLETDPPFVCVCAATSDLVTTAEAYRPAALPVIVPDHACLSDHLVELATKMGGAYERGQYPFPSLICRMVPVRQRRVRFACWNPAILFQAIPHTVGEEQKCVTL